MKWVVLSLASLLLCGCHVPLDLGKHEQVETPSAGDATGTPSPVAGTSSPAPSPAASPTPSAAPTPTPSPPPPVPSADWTTPAVDPHDHASSSPNPATATYCSLARAVNVDGSSHLLAIARQGVVRAELREISHWPPSLDPAQGEQVRSLQTFTNPSAGPALYDCTSLRVSSDELETCDGAGVSGALGTVGYVDEIWTVWLADGTTSTCQIRIDPK